MLSVTENFGEGSALFAAQLGVPEARGWTKDTDFLLAILNATTTNTVARGTVPKDKLKYFEHVQSPIYKRFVELQKEAKQAAMRDQRRTKRAAGAPIDSVLTAHTKGGDSFDSLDDLPVHLKSPKQ